jgi:4-hydroxy-tetrahydrodipicolinate reductase
MSTKVVIVGAMGRMGQTAVRCLKDDPRFDLVGLVGRTSTETHGQPVETNLADVLARTQPEILLELTTGRTAGQHALAGLKHGAAVVVGATGLSEADLKDIQNEATTKPCLMVPNFALGAVLMMQFAELAAKWLPDVEIIELHHEKKADAPSGTAMSTAQRISRARIKNPTSLPSPLLKAEGARGASVAEVPVHSIRLRGLLAHQEVIFGGQGEALTIRHDSLDRSSFESGICLSCANVGSLKPGLHVGLEAVM